MAVALTEEDLLKCAICFEFYRTPRKLPRCGHTFCELCMLTYLKALKEKNELKGEFFCPICRTAIPGQKSKDLLDWVKSYELDANVISQLKTKFHVCMESQSADCSPCTELGKSTKAEQFCVDCSESLCISCTKVHKAYKVSKNHVIVEILKDNARMKSASDLIQMISLYTVCQNHSGRKIEYYCRDHDALFCVACAIVEHRKCELVFDLSQSLDKQRIAKDTEDLTTTIGKLGAHANSIVQVLTHSEEANKTQMNKIAAAVAEIKTKVGKILEKLEDNINKQAKALVKKCEMTRQSNIEKARDVMRELRELKSMLQKALKDDAECEAYILTQKLRKRIGDLRCTLNEVSTTAQTFSLELEMTKMLTDVILIGTENTEKLALVKLEENPIKIGAFSGESLTNLSDLHIKKNCTKYIEGDVSNPTYSSLTYVEDKLLLLDSYTNKCGLVNENGKIASMLSFAGEASSITDLRNGLIAIGFSELKKIRLISVAEMCLKVELNTSYGPKALCGLQNGDLAVSWEGPVAFGIVWPYLDLPEKVYFCEDKTGRKLKSFDYIAVDEKRSRVIQPCCVEKAVFCFDFSGNPKYKYTSTDLVKPRGVALDSCGNAYVCENAKSLVHVISPTGLSIRILKEDSLKTPLAIGFTQRGNAFAVTQMFFACCYITFFDVSLAP